MKNNPIRIIIRVDASHVIGTGHLMRCLTLAKALRNSGGEVVFVCREHVGNLIQQLEAHHFDVYRLPVSPKMSIFSPNDYSAWLGVTQEQDAIETSSVLKNKSFDWLIVDHYALDIIWEKKMRSWVGQILAIDDLANRDHDCDVLLDQNYFGKVSASRYDTRISHECQRLLGPSYALLQPEYAQLRSILPLCSGQVHRVLVFLGGYDGTEETSKVLAALSYPDVLHWSVDVVIGANYPNIEKLEAEVNQRPSTSLYRMLPTLAGLMARADLVIGAGGATTWERMCLGLPSLVVSVAENQVAFTQALTADEFQASISAGPNASIEDWHQAIFQLIQDPVRLIQLAQNARQLVDGEGCQRVVSTIFGFDEIRKSLIHPSPEEKLSLAHRVIHQRKKLNITILSDKDTWMLDTINVLQHRWTQEGHQVRLAHDPAHLSLGDVCFILSCSRIIKPEQMCLHRYNLVVHAAALPEGRGWSPMTWQILEGRSEFCVTLFEAVTDVDAGPIYAQETLYLDGTELVDEWRCKLAETTQQLCSAWVAGFPDSASHPREQVGTVSHYPRRRAEDSQLNPEKSLFEQFNVLRVVDNEKYPAFFDLHGKRYRLLINVIE